MPRPDLTRSARPGGPRGTPGDVRGYVDVDLSPDHGQPGGHARRTLAAGWRGASRSRTTMTAMRSARRGPLPVAVALVAALGSSACGGSVAASPRSVPSATPVASSVALHASAVPGQTAVAEQPSLTPVPGGQGIQTDPAGTHIPTTPTGWGEILDALPDSFPMYPGAEIADVDGGLFSGSFGANASAADVAAWYRAALGARDAVELSQPLEDGSLVLDAQADLPECRIQMAFRPADGSTIIT